MLFLQLFLVFSLVSFGQTSEKLRSIEGFQKKINQDFRDVEKTPLTSKDRKEFEGLEFYKIDTSFTVIAQFVRTPYEAPFSMPTTTNRLPVYVKYGELYFELKGKNFKLNVYQSQDLLKDPDYVDYLFLPFTDLTNNTTSYAGGRYIELRIPSGSTVSLDFNQAYNPYCAYNGKYSCPIPPSENFLDVEIKAGVKAFKK